jgi:hypothetical protein
LEIYVGRVFGEDERRALTLIEDVDFVRRRVECLAADDHQLGSDLQRRVAEQARYGEAVLRRLQVIDLLEICVGS